ncbi:CopG family transcriptional regulator [Flexivirga alba]|uniref:CopG family transcriptional regulator n=1 Tax=Flexivirga alba TaxID=702742 RepID=A0ABW2AGL3_9MICO
MSFTLRTDDELDEALRQLSEREGVSRQEVVRRAILERQRTTEHTAAIDDVLDRMMTEWGDVLERLKHT